MFRYGCVESRVKNRNLWKGCIARLTFFNEVDGRRIVKRCQIPNLAQGKNVCVAEGLDRDSWGADILPYLPYFQSDGIQDKIQRLTHEIELKNRALARARRHPKIQKKR